MIPQNGAKQLKSWPQQSGASPKLSIRGGGHGKRHHYGTALIQQKLRDILTIFNFHFFEVPIDGVNIRNRRHYTRRLPISYRIQYMIIYKTILSELGCFRTVQFFT